MKTALYRLDSWHKSIFASHLFGIHQFWTKKTRLLQSLFPDNDLGLAVKQHESGKNLKLRIIISILIYPGCKKLYRSLSGTTYTLLSFLSMGSGEHTYVYLHRITVATSAEHFRKPLSRCSATQFPFLGDVAAKGHCIIYNAVPV